MSEHFLNSAEYEVSKNESADGTFHALRHGVKEGAIQDMLEVSSLVAAVSRDPGGYWDDEEKCKKLARNDGGRFAAPEIAALGKYLMEGKGAAKKGN